MSPITPGEIVIAVVFAALCVAALIVFGLSTARWKR
jgi:hypothetical protein